MVKKEMTSLRSLLWSTTNAVSTAIIPIHYYSACPRIVVINFYAEIFRAEIRVAEAIDQKPILNHESEHVCGINRDELHISCSNTRGDIGRTRGIRVRRLFRRHRSGHLEECRQMICRVFKHGARLNRQKYSSGSVIGKFDSAETVLLLVPRGTFYTWMIRLFNII